MERRKGGKKKRKKLAKRRGKFEREERGARGNEVPHGGNYRVHIRVREKRKKEGGPHLQVQPGFNATVLSGGGIRKRGNRNEKLESLCPTTVIASSGDVRGGYR